MSKRERMDSRNAAMRSLSVSFDCFDTANALTLYGPAANQGLLDSLKATCIHFDALWDFSKPESDVARIACAGAGESVKVNQLTVDLLRKGFAFMRDEPLFNLCIGPVTKLWKHAAEKPSQEALVEALLHADASGFVLGEDSVTKNDAMARVDVGGIAKGYIADCLAQAVRDSGIESACLNLGGNLYMVGAHPQDRPWRLDVALPGDFPCKRPLFELVDASVSTSSNFERAEYIDGVEYGHIISPVDGMPVDTDIASATVISHSSLEADMLSTVILASGSEGLSQVIERHPGTGAIVVTKKGQIRQAGLPNRYARMH